MSGIGLDSRGLLEYNSRYGVLICRECQYAIQKSAVDSHLLRHKIYRGERQKLLSSIAQLDILEPELVPLPTSESPPIDALPIISGYRCVTSGCGNLCASTKRMQRHRSEVHGLSEPTSFSSYARPVNLQTFFRGTKIRYFEVNSLPPLAATTDDENRHGQCGEETQDEQMHEADRTITVPPHCEPTVVGTRSKSSLLDIDLETLTYFYHYTSMTSLTLPGAENYWQTTVVFQALQRRWLMCGLLALAACHLAATSDSAKTQHIHYQRAAQLYSSFLTGLDENPASDLDLGSDEEAKKAGGQIGCILDCTYWAFDTFVTGSVKEGANSFQLQDFMVIMRSLVMPDFADRSGDIRTDGEDCAQRTAAYAQASGILNMRNALAARRLDAGDSMLPALLNRLTELPFHMAEIFGKPENARDVMVPLSAIASLVECCDIAFTSHDVGAAWKAMTTWLTKVPDYFNDMVSNDCIVALVVLAHWAASLVQRAENCGCWFLKGSSQRILLLIVERLPPDNHAVQGLVADLIT
jgi:hypothetical protein